MMQCREVDTTYGHTAGLRLNDYRPMLLASCYCHCKKQMKFSSHKLTVTFGTNAACYICAKFHDNQTCRPTFQAITTTVSNKPTNKQTWVITIPPGECNKNFMSPDNLSIYFPLTSITQHSISVDAMWTSEWMVDFDHFDSTCASKFPFQFQSFWLTNCGPYIGLTGKVLTVAFARCKPCLFKNFGILIFSQSLTMN